MSTYNEGAAALPRDKPLDDLPAGKSPQNGTTGLEMQVPTALASILVALLSNSRLSPRRGRRWPANI